MALYVYTKKVSSRPRFIEPFPKKIPKKYFSFVLSLMGLILIGNAIVPILTYQLRYATKFGENILSPLVYDKSEVLGTIQAMGEEEYRDYTLISSWFDEPVGLENGSYRVDSYGLSIPDLDIVRANVRFETEDLKRSLVHYSETALPGQLGNVVIFGHSVLPQFFNPENYLTIFSTLYRLQEGNEIWLHFDNVDYRYLVEDLFEVPASDLSVLEQRYDMRMLTLITCSPPGTYLRRLVVRARLID